MVVTILAVWAFAISIVALVVALRKRPARTTIVCRLADDHLLPLDKFADRLAERIRKDAREEFGKLASRSERRA